MYPGSVGEAVDDLAKSIFLDALEIASEPERLAYVSRRCGPDQNLRSEVETLLRHQGQIGDYLERPAVDLEESRCLTPRRTTEGPGTVIGPYKLVQELGAGGMGEVWMAEQTHPVRRKVALKLIKAGVYTRQVLARFEAEHQALAMMDHPNIAKVFDAGATPYGRPFFVMELVQGVPITTYCDDHHLTPRERLGLFLSVCHAVQHAHQKGIIHRDLKPSNVLVTLRDDEPLPKVIDFGVAKATGERLTKGTAVTQCGQLVGTLEYMSPEQASFALDIDTRSDIYSLGVLLYELLTGSTPFAKRLREVAFDEGLRIIREEEPPRASTRLSTTGELPTITEHCNTESAHLRRLLKGDLDWILLRCLEKDRNRRYETANGLAMDLKRYLADEPVAACPPSVRYRLRKIVRRHKGPVLAASLVVLALMGGIIGTTWGLIRANDQLVLALLHQARAGRLSGQMGQRLDSLEALARAARIRRDERLRDEAIAAMALPDVRLVPVGHPAPPGIVSIAYDAEHGLCARVDTRGSITIHRLSDDQEVRRIASDIGSVNLCLSPDGRFLLGRGKGETLSVWRVADGRQVLRDQPRGCHAYAFSPDCRCLAVSQQSTIVCFDLATGRALIQWHLPSRACTLAFHPRDGRLAVGYEHSEVVSVYDSANGALLTDLPVGELSNQVVAWHPDGHRLAVAGSDPRIQLWNVAARRKLATLEGHVQNVTDLTFHPAGNVLASHGWDGQLFLWQPSSGRRLMSLTFVNDDCPAQFSTDGRWLGFTWDGERANLLEVTRSDEYRTLTSSAAGEEISSWYGDFSPDGQLLAVGMDQGTRLWDLRSGRELVALPAGTSYVCFETKAQGERGPITPKNPPWVLLTGGRDGLLRWRVTSRDTRGKHLRLGPPEQLSPLCRACFGQDPDGRRLAAMTGTGRSSKIMDLETGKVRQELGIHPLGELHALSGDGRWAASCGWHSDRVYLWNAKTGQRVSEWVVGRQTLVFFSPDSRALIIARGDAFSFWDVETLQPIRRLHRDLAQFPGWVAFSPDGQLMALEMAPAVIHLIQVATGRTVARFADPHRDRATWQGFTPDGTQLVVLAAHTRAIHIWDLRAVRARLKDMNLDWDWAEFPPATVEESAAEPFTIEVIPGVPSQAGEGTRRDASRHRESISRG
jgi:serine/threonine protein kinase/WD40 repeat protein